MIVSIMTSETLRFTDFDARAYADSMPYDQMRVLNIVEDPLGSMQSKLMRMRAEIDAVAPEVPEISPAMLTLHQQIGRVTALTIEGTATVLADRFAHGTESTVQELFGANASPRVLRVSPSVGRAALVAA